MSTEKDREVQAILYIQNKKGLHARAAAKFVKCVEEFDAEVSVTKQENSVSGASIMGLMMLAASKGTTIDISAEGPDAKAVVDALIRLVDARFDED
jgi:phosphocarrier protein HPr